MAAQSATMEGNNGFLSTEAGLQMDDAKSSLNSSCLLDTTSDGCTKYLGKERVAWLDDYKDEACRVARYPDTSAIPGPILAAFNVCVNKSGLSKALPTAIMEDRKKYVEKLQTIVRGSARQSEPSNGSWVEPTDNGGQALSSFPFQDSPSWEEGPTYSWHGRALQQLEAPSAYVNPPEETTSSSSALSMFAYLESMPYYLLPIFVGFVLAGVFLPVFLLFFCLRNRKCSRRVCSCWCCFRLFFKSRKRRASHVEPWDSNRSSSTASDSQVQGGVGKLVPRRACMGTRYLVLLMAIVAIAASLSLGIIALLDLHAMVSQLGCLTGQAGSTIVNGQTFTSPIDPVRPYGAASSPLVSPFHAPSPFSVEAPLATTEAPRTPVHPSFSGLGSAARAARVSPGKTGQTVPRSLQSESGHTVDDGPPPKRTGFIGFTPALDYLEDLVVALDLKRSDSLPQELRQARETSARIAKTVSDVKRNFTRLQEAIYNPANSGVFVSVNKEGEPTERKATYHISPVSVAAPSLLSSWETLVHLLPQGLAAIAESSDTLAGDIERSLDQTGSLPPVKELQETKVFLADSLVAARRVLEPLPSISGPIFWGSIAAFSVMGSLLLLASLYLCCMCCCKKEALVDRKGSSCGCSFLMLLIASLALVTCSMLLVATIVVTDGCLYTRDYVKNSADVDDLLSYFSGNLLALGSGALRQHEPTTAAKVLEACFLPNKERDLVRVFGMEDLLETGEKMRELGSTALRGETSAALLLSLQLQEAARELQLVDETSWLFLLDPLALKDEDLEERLFTYREVLCSGIQDKQRAVRASYLSPSPGEAAAAQGAAGRSAQRVKPLLLPSEALRPEHELATLLQELTPDPQVAQNLSHSVQQTLQEIKRNGGTSGKTAKGLIAGVIGDLMELADGKSEAQKVNLMQSVVRLAGKANAEYQESTNGNGSAKATKQRKSLQQGMLLKLLREICIGGGGTPADPQTAASPDHLVVFGMEDVEELVAPFSLSSLHSSSSSTGDSRLTIDPSFDPSSPLVFELASAKGPADEQRRFLNAVWWAAKKEQLRAEASASFVCPPTTQEEEASGGAPCSFEEMQEAAHKLTRLLHAQLDDLWMELRQFFEKRSRLYRLLGEDVSEAASNLDCRIVHNEVQPVAELVCDKVRIGGGNVAFVLLIVGCAALLLLPIFCCLWGAGVENTWRQRDAERMAAADSRRDKRDWSSRSPSTTNISVPQNNAAAVAAVAVAAAATAAAASGLAQQQPMQQQQQRQPCHRAHRDEDWE